MSQDNNNKKVSNSNKTITNNGSDEKQSNEEEFEVEELTEDQITQLALTRLDQQLQSLHISGPHNKFNIQLVCNSFSRSIKDKSEICMFMYLEAFNELNKFFNMFGTLFTFVTKDVQSKITILHSYTKDPDCGFHYQTIQSMINYEKKLNILKDNKRPSGSRTLLRLHRALEFISTFLHEVTKLEDDHTTSHAAKNAYNRTLSKYHQWYIRQSVHLAMFALPYRKNLIERVYAGELPSGGSPEVNENLSHMANIADQVFNATEKLYEEHNLLDLP